MEARARQGYFVRDPGRNLVVCPNGERLRQKSVGKGGSIRYANRVACGRCPFKDRCLGGKQSFKDIGFTKDQPGKPSTKWHEAAGTEPDRTGVGKGRYHYEKVRVVRFRLRPDIVKTSARMGTSEHPFGSIKRALGADHFLTRGIGSVEGEFALACLAYNLRRARSILGFDGLLAALAA
jgi:transposase